MQPENDELTGNRAAAVSALATYICIHTYVYYVRSYIHTYVAIYTYIYIRTYIHTYIHIYIRTYIHTYIKTHCRVSVAKKALQHTSVLFTGTAKSPFSTLLSL